MNDIYAEDFQHAVNELIMRNRSILDILSKFECASSKVNRACVKAVTNCGCLSITAKKQNFPEGRDFEGLSKLLDSHLKGKLCANCMQTIEDEIGGVLFYLAALCNTLNISLYDVILKEKKRLDTLGPYSLK
jgi:NTP pyrophosphatase (non-canonical NTP hydrolase)